MAGVWHFNLINSICYMETRAMARLSQSLCGKATKKAADAAFHVPGEPVYLGCNFNAAELMQ